MGREDYRPIDRTDRYFFVEYREIRARQFARERSIVKTTHRKPSIPGNSHRESPLGIKRH